MLKKALLLICSLSVFISFSQNDKTTFLENFDKTGMETSIFYLLPTDLDSYKNESANMYNFYQIYKSIAQSDLKNRLPSLSELKKNPKSDIIQLSILHAEYDAITKEAITTGSIIQDSNGKIVRTNNEPIFEKKEITIASPLILKKKGLNQVFNLKSNNIYNTTGINIKSIEIDFDNGKGYKTIIPNQSTIINYSSVGLKKIDFTITFEDNTIEKSSSSIKIEYSNSELNSLFGRVINTFTGTTIADLAAYGETTSFAGTGEYEIFLSDDNILDKPIFIIDGFDPGDTRPIVGYTDNDTGDYVSGIYDLLNFNNNGIPSNLGDLVRIEDYDIVILNSPVYTNSGGFEIDGGSDYIERNAMLLVDLIDIINTHPDKVGNEENVIIGPSMGGLISRYALNYMESESIDHNTRLWLSFDSPHHGANVPIGFQHLFNYLGYGLDTWVGDFSLESLRPVVDGMLKSSAARQMLTDQFEPHLANGEIAEFNPNLTLPIAHSFKDIFYNSLNSLTTSGFPEDLRKISVINGSGEGNSYQHQDGSDVEPGDKVLDAFISNVAFLTDAHFDVWFTPTAGQQIKVDNIWIDAPFLCFCDIGDAGDDDDEAYADSEANSYSDGIDAASGGLFDLVSLATGFGTGDSTITAFFNSLNIDYFNFIPSVSAMALNITNNEIDWFHTPSNLTTGRGVDNTTPFDAWYMPTDNESHVTVTQDNFDFAWYEIVLAPLNNDEFDLNNNYKLIKNPVSENIQIQMNKLDVNSFNPKVYSITGQELVSKVINNPSNQLSIPVNLRAGIYLLELNDSETIFKTKIIIK
jgi:hypothetical protein